MKPFATLAEIRRRSAEAVISQSGINNSSLTSQLRVILGSDSASTGAILQEPVVEGAHPFVTAEETMGTLPRGVLHHALIEVLDDIPDDSGYRFPKRRKPFRHQLEAWKALATVGSPQSVLVTSGTGSGKTECFMFPILSTLAEQISSSPQRVEGVQAIMLYPLNALIESQRSRLSAWTKPFGGKLRYCLYNGALEKDQEPESKRRRTPEQQIDRHQLRDSPPPILVTNVTMLEYMLARAEDQPIIEKSKGKLKWIVLDEAHSLVGAAAAEIALLLRRVLIAFDTKPESVHFVATSATIGSGATIHKQLREFLAEVAGIPDAQVHVIEGERQIPGQPPAYVGSLVIDPETSTPNDLYRKLGGNPEAWKFVTTGLFKAAQPLSEFTRLGTKFGLDGEGFMTALASAVRSHPETGEPEHLAPLRIHSFERAIPGFWGCINPTCQSSPEGWPYGRIYPDRRETCEDCGGPVLELICCYECGEPMLEGEEDLNSGVLRSSRRAADTDEFEAEADRESDIDGDDNDLETVSEDYPSKRTILFPATASDGFRPLHLSRNDWTVQPAKTDATLDLRFEEKPTDSCPCCGANAPRGMDSLLRPIRFGAPFLIGSAAPILLEGVDPVVGKEKTLPSSGRNLLSFTDSRQGTARMSAKIQAEAERNFIRSFVYHSVQSSLVTRVPDGEVESLFTIISVLEQSYATNPNIVTMRVLEENRQKLARLTSPQTGGIQWSVMVDRLSERPEIESWIKDVWEPRDGDFSDSRKLAEFLLLREFTRRPRKANSVETLGLARLRFTAIDDLKVMPTAMARRGKTIEDWRQYLHAVATFFMRSNSAIDVPYSLMHWIMPKQRLRSIIGPGRTADGDRSLLAWPMVPKNTATLSTPQMLLIRGLSLDITSETDRADMMDCLDGAWNSLQLILGANPERRALDFQKAHIAPMTEAHQCPVTRRLLDVAPFGLTPYARGDRFSNLQKTTPVVVPLLPVSLLGQVDLADGKRIIREWLETDPSIASMKALSAWSGIFDRVALFADYSRSAEHSAQQESALLRQYEDQFKQGRINILNCSTTMEMGVDIGSVSTVMMTNVPPSIANYRQRVGRAGRRNQPYSLSFTFCRDRPLDRETFTRPLGYLTSTVSAPKVALNSRPIVQRHVNAYLLRQFMLARGGNTLRMTIGGLMGCPGVVGEKRPIKSERPVETFKEWLELPSVSAEVKEDLEKLVRRSVLEGEIRLIDSCRESISELEEGFSAEWAGLQALALDEGMKEAGKSRMGVELKRLCDEFLLSALADRGFLPGHGFPTGVVTFVPHKARTALPVDGRRQTYLTGPQRSLDLAIRDYAPGSEVVLDGLVHRSAGVLLNWKRPATEDNIREVQSLKFHWSCRHCGSTASTRELITECTSCGTNVHCQEYLRPSGFSVDSREKPHADTDRISYVAPEEPSVSVGEADWISLPIPGLGRHRASREGAVYYTNRGPNKSGYSLCLHCGRAAPEHPISDDADHSTIAPSLLDGHKPLRWRQGDNALVCEGNSSSWKVKRNLDLGYEITTDVFELQPSHPLQKAAASALIIAIRRALAESLGVEASEMGFSTYGSLGPLGQRCRSMLVFDRAAGGAGFSVSMSDKVGEVLGRAAKVLDCLNPGCEDACASCVLTSDAPFEDGGLDRKEALAYLRAYLTFPSELEHEDRLSPDAVLSLAAVDEIDRELLASSNPVLDIFLPEAFDPAALSAWPAVRQFETWIYRGYRLNFVVSERSLSQLDQASKLALNEFGHQLRRVGSPFPVSIGSPVKGVNGALVFAAVTVGNKSVIWGGRDTSAIEPGATWALPGEKPIVRGSFSGLPARQTLDPKSLLQKASAKMVQISTDLDRAATLFGKGMAETIRRMASELGFSKDLQIETIEYTDPFVRSPLVTKLLIDTVSSLYSNQPGKRALKVSTRTPQDTDRNPPRRLSDDWRDVETAKGVITEYGGARKLDVSVAFGDVPHGRYMVIRYVGGKKMTVLFDQGFGAWALTSYGNSSLHDFRAPFSRQSDAMSKSSAMVAKRGIGSTYLVATNDG